MVIGVEVDDEALKDWFNHVDASDSGVGEVKKMSKSGTHCSIFACSVTLCCWVLEVSAFWGFESLRRRGKIKCSFLTNR